MLAPQETMLVSWIATWKSATHVGDGSLALRGQETHMGVERLEVMQCSEKEKKVLTIIFYSATKILKTGCVNSVATTCNNIIMGNCVEHFLP